MKKVFFFLISPENGPSGLVDFKDEKISSRFSLHFKNICIDCSIDRIFCSNFQRKTIYFNSLHFF